MKKLVLLLLALPLAACATPHNNTAREFPFHPFAGVPAYAHFEPYVPR